MESTDGMTRGDEVIDTGNQIQVPVGPETLGRIMNVVGEPVDERGEIKSADRWAIHRDAPQFVDQATETEILVTGIKVVDLLAPYSRGGKIGLMRNFLELMKASMKQADANRSGMTDSTASVMEGHSYSILWL